MRPVLFLDFDGVLNNEAHLYAVRDRKYTPPDRYVPWHDLKPELVEMVGDWVRDNGIDVVLSTAWRELFDYDDLLGWLSAVGGLEGVIGKTPSIAGLNLPRGCIERGYEIRAWLDANGERPFCILDDMPVSDFPTVEHAFVQTNYRTGVTREDLDECMRILAAQ